MQPQKLSTSPSPSRHRSRRAKAPLDPILAAICRQQLLNRFNELVEHGCGRYAAARQLGRGYTTIWRWLALLATQGVAGLQGRRHRSGRKRLLTKLAISPEVIREIQLLAVNLGSARLAWTQFAERADCPAALAQFIRSRKHLPESLIVAVALRRRVVHLREAGDFAIIEELNRAHVGAAA